MGASRVPKTSSKCRSLQGCDLWRYEWVRVDEEWVRVVVPGPFADSAAALLSPIPSPSCRCSRGDPLKSSRARGGKDRRLENGIPEPWLEELLRDDGEERVVQEEHGQGERRLERNHERLTRYLWLQRGLALAQGIPDPWRQVVECSCHKEVQEKSRSCHPKNPASSLHKSKDHKSTKSKSTRPGRKSLEANRIECRRASFDRMKQHLSELEADLLRKQADLERRTKSKGKTAENGRRSKKKKSSAEEQPKVELSAVEVFESCELIVDEAVNVEPESKSVEKIEEVRLVEQRPATPSQIPKMIKRSRVDCGTGKQTRVKVDVAKPRPKTRTQSNCGQSTSPKVQDRRKSGPIPGYKCGSRCNGGRWSGCSCGSGPSPRRLLGQIDSRIKVTRDALDSQRSEASVADARLRAGADEEPETELLFRRSRSKPAGPTRTRKLDVQEADSPRLRAGGKRELDVTENLVVESLSSGR